MKPTKILAAYDYSQAADGALEMAGDIAHRNGASITLVNVHMPQLEAVPEVHLMRQSDEMRGVIADLERKLTERAEKLRAATGSEVQTRLRSGDPAREIVREAAEGGYDLIVMATHGRTGLSHLLMGSVAEKVLRTASCPVLTVRMGQRSADSAG